MKSNPPSCLGTKPLLKPHDKLTSTKTVVSSSYGEYLYICLNFLCITKFGELSDGIGLGVVLERRYVFTTNRDGMI
jgi:hypothetical protein